MQVNARQLRGDSGVTVLRPTPPRYHPQMPLLTDDAPALPLDAQGILELAARSMFQLFSSVSQGMFLVDRSGRIVWVNEPPHFLIGSLRAPS